MIRTLRAALPLTLLLAAGARAEEPLLPPMSIEGPLAQGEGRISGRGTLSLALLPKDESQPIEVFGKPIPVTVELLATPTRQGDHPFELFVAVFPLEDEAPADPVEPAVPAEPAPELPQAAPYIRCGTVTAEGAPPVPGSAISTQIIEPTWRELKEDPERQARAVYSVAPTKQVSVGVVDFPRLAEAALLEDTIQRMIPSITFTVSIAPGAPAHFYTETPFAQGILIMKVDIPTWDYPEPAVAPAL